MKKLIEIRDIPWYQFSLIRHTNYDEPKSSSWSDVNFCKRMFVDHENKIIYTLTAESENLNRLYNSNIIEDFDSTAVEFYINQGVEIVGFAQRYFEGADIQIFSLLQDTKYCQQAEEYMNRWREVVNNHGFFWDISDCRVHEDKIYPIDIDVILESTNKLDWPAWTQIRKSDYLLTRDFQEIFSAVFNDGNPHSWVGALHSNSITWKDYKESKHASLHEIL
tara:strand:- start:481 stop:1143 length:663 start_codon:yes stop_codon:yes gene_type:complete